MTDDELRALDAYWRAANYLSVGQIYLLDNPLLREPLRPEHVKPRLLGHWGTTPGLNFLYTHLNRAIRARDLDAIFVCGPGHGGPAVVAQSYLEGTYSGALPARNARRARAARAVPAVLLSRAGSRATRRPRRPARSTRAASSGYALSHAYGAAFDDPRLTVACVVGDGEAETGPLATSWHSNKFSNPERDGRVLPILHLNGYKIANPTVLARIPDDELVSLLRGYGHEPLVFTAGFDDEDFVSIHGRFAELDSTARLDDRRARRSSSARRRAGPGPREVDGLQVEGTWRAHQVPLAEVRTNAGAPAASSRSGCAATGPRSSSTSDGALVAELVPPPPEGERRMSANPKTNGGLVLRDLELPDFRRLRRPGGRARRGDRRGDPRPRRAGSPRSCARTPTNFRIFGPDETASNRLDAVYEVTDKQWDAARRLPVDEHLAPSGRVMEMLSEHQCQGWLEGYLLTGRHGLFNCYEAFIHIVDSMFNQHAKWLKVTRGIAWRRPLASLNYLLSLARLAAGPQRLLAPGSWLHRPRHEQEGRDHPRLPAARRELPALRRRPLPPQPPLRERHRRRQAARARSSCRWTTRSSTAPAESGSGTGPRTTTPASRTSSSPAAGTCPRSRRSPQRRFSATACRKLKVRVVNVVDLMRLQPESEHPHGLPDHEFDALFTTHRPIVFAYHGYPWLIHRLTYRRTNHDNLHVRGYKEEGTTTTPFDMVMLNDLDRYHLVIDVIDRVPGLADRAGHLRQEMEDARLRARAYVYEHGEDAPEVAEWRWQPEATEAP